jgi:hypothetical protein
MNGCAQGPVFLFSGGPNAHPRGGGPKKEAPAMSLTEAFIENPLTFLKTHPFDPGEEQSTEYTDTTIFGEGLAKRYFSALNDERGIINRHYQALPQSYSFERGTKLKNKNAVVLKVATASEESIDAYYLPWVSQAVTSMTLPQQGEEKYFFTAALSGCSVFVRGNAVEPTVYHAGNTGTAENEAVCLWDACMKKLGRGHETPKYYGINKYDYIKEGAGLLKGAKRKITQLEKEDMEYDVTPRYYGLTLISPAGCVVGIKDRQGRWDFYLQERLCYQVVEHGSDERFTYWTPTSLRRFYPTGAKQVQLIPKIKVEGGYY